MTCAEMVENYRKSAHITNVQTIQKRNSSIPSRFNQFIVLEPLPSENVRLSKESLRGIFGFAPENTELWKAMEALSPNSPYFLQYDVLKPLYDYPVTIPAVSEFFVKLKVSDADLGAECRIFSRALGGKTWHADENGKIDLVDVANMVEKDHGKTTPVLTELYKVAVTTGFTSTRVECLFSSLTRVDSPQRRSMKTKGSVTTHI